MAFDLELPRAEELKRPDGEEAHIQVLNGSGSIHCAGTLFKTGITVINGHELSEAHGRLEEKKVKDKEDQAKAVAKAEVAEVWIEIEAMLQATLFFWVWGMGLRKEV